MLEIKSYRERDILSRQIVKEEFGNQPFTYNQAREHLIGKLPCTPYHDIHIGGWTVVTFRDRWNRFCKRVKISRSDKNAKPVLYRIEEVS